jgi:hypothetical protein
MADSAIAFDPITLAASASGAELATAPATTLLATLKTPRPRHAALLIAAAAGCTLAAPKLRGYRGGAWYHVDDVMQAGADLVIASGGPGLLVPLQNVLALVESLWVYTATISGGPVTVSLVPIETR